MWDLALSTNATGVPSDLRVEVRDVVADENQGRAIMVDEYAFRDTKRPVRNLITSTFNFRGGKISRQLDSCDAVSWAKQALGGFHGFVAGRVEFVRRWKAMGKLKTERPNAFNS